MCAAPKGNQYAKNNEGGQPLKFKSVEELDTKIEAYFKSCYITSIDPDTNEEYQKNVKPLTLSGLAVYLECDRRTLLNYGNKEEYFPTIHKARVRVESYAEENLFTARNPAGTIFSLKNNYGWIDKQEITQDINANINKITVAPVVFDED